MNLHSLYAAQKSHWAQHGNYSTILSGNEGIGWKPEGYHGGGVDENFYYTYGFANGSEGTNYFTGKLQTSHTYLNKAHANQNEFLIIAAGDILGNGKPDILSVDHHNKITFLQDALSQ